MFQEWPRMVAEMGAPVRKHWWSMLRERDADVAEKVEMEET